MRGSVGWLWSAIACSWQRSFPGQETSQPGTDRRGEHDQELYYQDIVAWRRVAVGAGSGVRTRGLNVGNVALCLTELFPPRPPILHEKSPAGKCRLPILPLGLRVLCWPSCDRYSLKCRPLVWELHQLTWTALGESGQDSTTRLNARGSCAWPSIHVRRRSARNRSVRVPQGPTRERHSPRDAAGLGGSRCACRCMPW